MNEPHLNVKCVSRSKGGNAVKAAAYQNGERLHDTLTGKVYKYPSRGRVVVSAIVLPLDVPGMSSEVLWNMAEAAETRCNSTVARTLVVSVPCGLPFFVNESLVARIAHWLVNRYGFAAEYSIHRPVEENDPRNWHAHLLCSTRQIDLNGFGKKCRILDQRKTGSVEILAWRECWVAFVNEELCKLPQYVLLDHRSFANRGKFQIPTETVGYAPGRKWRLLENERRKMNNLEMQNIDAEIAELERIREQIVADENQNYSGIDAISDLYETPNDGAESVRYERPGM